MLPDPRIVDAGRWNHNIHYQHAVLDAVPPDARRALDVGCGEGITSRALRARVTNVVGVDRDAASVALARDQGGDIRYLVGDVLALPFARASFDVVVSVATLHHLDAEAGLAAMVDMVRPGGVLAVLGLARSGVADLPVEAAALAVERYHQHTKEEWTTPAPVSWPPPLTYRETKRLTASSLPGRRYRRHLLWRWSLVWTKPA